MIENNKEKTEVLIALSILCFFPPAFYLRLTMKPEAMAFAIMPWCIYLTYKHISEKKNIHYSYPLNFNGNIIIFKRFNNRYGDIMFFKLILE